MIATSPFEFEDLRLRWAYEVPLDGSAASRLPYGPLDTLAHGPALGDERPLVIGSVLSREPARWKRYRGGTAGKLWIDADGNGEFVRLVPELDGNLAYPMWIEGRIAFFSDHEGYGNIYSVTPSGTDLRRHTDFQDFYVRHPSSDGTRIIFESAGSLWLLPSLDAEPERLDITLGSAGTSRRPRPLNAAQHLRTAVPDTNGSSSVVETHGTLHWLTHKDGPSRVIEATPGVRARLGRPLPGGRAVFVADPDNEEALFIKDVFASLPAAGDPRPASVPAPAPAQAQARNGQAETELPRPVSALGRPAAGSTAVPAAAVHAPAPAGGDEGPEDSQGARPTRCSPRRRKQRRPAWFEFRSRHQPAHPSWSPARTESWSPLPPNSARSICSTSNPPNCSRSLTAGTGQSRTWPSALIPGGWPGPNPLPSTARAAGSGSGKPRQAKRLSRT